MMLINKNKRCFRCKFEKAIVNFNNFLLLTRGIKPPKIYIICNHLE